MGLRNRSFNSQKMTENASNQQPTDDKSRQQNMCGNAASSAVCRLSSAVCFLAVALAGTAADLLSKHWVFQTLGGMPGAYKADTEPELHAVFWIWQNVFGFQLSLNAGALFGMAQGQTTILVAFSLLFLAGIVVYLLGWAWRSLFLTIILGMITAGICGNLYDRLGWHGLVYPDGQPIYAVRDWILCMIGTFPWPNFNIADSLMVCSVIVLLIHGLLFDTGECS
jgi:signal peptidase II